MNGYLLDSDVLIWCLRGREPTVRFLEELPPAYPKACSVLSVFEVLVGIRPGEERGTTRLLEGLVHEAVSSEAAREAAAYVRRFKRRGVTLDAVDALIAATALTEDLTLVTYNRKHYPMRDITVIGLTDRG